MNIYNEYLSEIKIPVIIYIKEYNSNLILMYIINTGTLINFFSYLKELHILRWVN